MSECKIEYDDNLRFYHEYCKRVYYDSSRIYYEKYYKYGKLHRENLPAVIKYHSNGNISEEIYFKEGKRHREDGPATIFYHSINRDVIYEFFNLYGKNYTDEDIINNWEAFCKMQIFR